MIISISGRKLTGKTTLANELVKRGFKRIGFADYLKTISSQIFNWKIKDMYDQNKKEKKINPILWKQSHIIKLAKITNINKNLITFEKNIVFNTRRDALTYIGMVLRKVDSNFHIKKLLSCINDNENWVIDDLRFSNEKTALESLKNSHIIHIIRPGNFNYSNHESEISLRRHDFENVVINDGSLSKLLRKFNFFVDYLLSNKKSNIIKKSELINILVKHDYDTKKVANELGCSRDKIVWWAARYLINIPVNKYAYNENAFNVFNPESSYWSGLISADGCIKKSGKNSMCLELSSNDLELTNGFKSFMKSNKPIYTKIHKINKKLNYYTTIHSPFIIDDLKMWNLEPKKSCFNKIPDCIKNNKNLLGYWITGLIDGGGCISEFPSSFLIRVLASREIVDFIAEQFPYNPHIRHEKKIKNLYKLDYYGEKAVQFYKDIYHGGGLERKWGKVVKYIDKKWNMPCLKKLTDIQVKQIKKLCASNIKAQDIAIIYNISCSTVYRIKNSSVYCNINFE